MADKEQPKSDAPAQIETDPEAQFKAKYGSLKPSAMAKRGLLTKDHKFFDSADWALAKEGQQKQQVPSAAGQPSPVTQPAVPASEPALIPKLEPSVLPARRISILESTHTGDV